MTEADCRKRHFLIIDEAADLADKKEAMELITDIVRKGRGVVTMSSTAPNIHQCKQLVLKLKGISRQGYLLS